LWTKWSTDMWTDKKWSTDTPLTRGHTKRGPWTCVQTKSSPLISTLHWHVDRQKVVHKKWTDRWILVDRKNVYRRADRQWSSNQWADWKIGLLANRKINGINVPMNLYCVKWFINNWSQKWLLNAAIFMKQTTLYWLKTSHKLYVYWFLFIKYINGNN